VAGAFDFVLALQFGVVDSILEGYMVYEGGDMGPFASDFYG